VPKKYQAKHVKSNRAGKYDDYLRRGLPVPEQFLPHADESVLKQRRVSNDAVLTRIATEGFEPRIRMPTPPQLEETPKVSPLEMGTNPPSKGESKTQTKCKPTHGQANCSYLSDYIGYSQNFRE
jgi:hypothetical protein